MKTLRDVMKMIRDKTEEERDSYENESEYGGRLVRDSLLMVVNMLDVAIEAGMSVDVLIDEPVNGVK